MASVYFELLCEVIGFAHYKNDNIQHVTEARWNKVISRCFEIGKELDCFKKQIKGKLDCELIAIYSYYKRYEEAYDIIITMAENNSCRIKLGERKIRLA